MIEKVFALADLVPHAPMSQLQQLLRDSTSSERILAAVEELEEFAHGSMEKTLSQLPVLLGTLEWSCQRLSSDENAGTAASIVCDLLSSCCPALGLQHLIKLATILDSFLRASNATSESDEVTCALGCATNCLLALLASASMMEADRGKLATALTAHAVRVASLALADKSLHEESASALRLLAVAASSSALHPVIAQPELLDCVCAHLHGWLHRVVSDECDDDVSMDAPAERERKSSDADENKLVDGARLVALQSEVLTLLLNSANLLVRQAVHTAAGCSKSDARTRCAHELRSCLLGLSQPPTALRDLQGLLFAVEQDQAQLALAEAKAAASDKRFGFYNRS